MLKNILAITATILTTASYIPQITKAYKTKSLEDISMGFLVMITAGIGTWILYAIFSHDMTFLIANCIIISLSITLIVMKLHYRRQSAKKLTKKI